MALQYWVGDRYIDLTRNQITRHETVLTLAPKALAVLTLLAKKQGSVVTQDELLDHVWKNSIVSPNTLQRSIAQLRKAFDDDAKQQRVIKTHSKRGYSLELTVSWQDSRDGGASISLPASNPAPMPRNKKLFLSFLGIVVVMGAAMLFKQVQGTKSLSIKSIQALTATDNKEFNAIYSADGEYIIFNRYHEKFCRSRIWAKHLGSQQETLLTPWGNYGSLSLSPNGRQLAFIERERCDTPQPATPCFSLKSLDFINALEGNSVVSTLKTCKSAQISSPQWLSDEALVLMHNPTNQWQLLKFSVADSKSEILYQPQTGSIRSFDIAPTEPRIGLILVDELNQPILELVTSDGERVSSNKVHEHPAISAYKTFYPRFVPNESSLIFSTGRQLFSLSYEGAVQRIMLPLDQAMGTPLFGPKPDKALAIKGVYDSDIGTLDLSKLENPLSPPISENQITNIARSNSGDADGVFQPGGHAIAFKSTRTGTEQLWLSDEGTLTQLTHLPLDSRIRGFRWSHDGSSLLLNLDGLLIVIPLNGAEQRSVTSGPITNLFYWNSDSDIAVVNMLEQGNEVFAQLDLATGDHIKLRDNGVVWAAVSDAGQFIYLDHTNQYWQSDVVEDALIAPLIAQGSDKRFILDGETLYGVNEDFQLWKYSLAHDEFTLLNFLPKNIDYLTDTRGDLLLLTYVVAAKKEIVELTLAE